jgi:hypothetical protein
VAFCLGHEASKTLCSYLLINHPAFSFIITLYIFHTVPLRTVAKLCKDCNILWPLLDFTSEIVIITK